MLRSISVLTLIAAVAVPGLAGAVPVFGSLANFDVVNDTGQTAHGFEIDLEGINKSAVTDVFGLNRNFGTPSPGDVERYGLPTLTDLTDGLGNVIGAKILYQGIFSGGTWSTGTPSGAFNTPGESCWIFGNVSYPNVPCDHFGVSTLGTPTKTTYSWLLDVANNGILTPTSVAIPSVAFTPPPPPTPANPAPPVNAVIQAVNINPVIPQDNAFWVKIVQTSLPDVLDLNDLMGGHHPFEVAAIADLNDKPETEIEWQVLQPGKVDEVSKAIDFNAGDDAVVIRYEFFKYLANFDDDGFVDPLASQFPIGNTLNQWVGDYVGEQVAGFNAVQPLAAAIPEPPTLLLLVAGLSLLGFGLRKSRQAISQDKYVRKPN